MKFANHAEDYIEPDGGGGYNYVYQYKDHLGNVRLSYTDANADGIVDVNEIVEESNYYPFGLKHRGYNGVVNGTDHPYGFGGKEEQNELELEWLDFSARNYDAALGRWMNIDPLAEDMRRHSPYNYGFDNPVYFIDPDGMAPRSMGGMDERSNFDFNIRDHRPYHASTYTDRSGKIIEHRNDGDSNIYIVLNPQNGLNQNWVIGTERPGVTYNVGDRISRGDLNANYRDNFRALPSEFRTGIEIADIESRGATYGVFWAGEFMGNLNPRQILRLAKNLRRLILKGRMLKGVKRVDIPKLDPKGNPIHGQKPHLHLDDGRALNLDGTWKHGTGSVPKKILKWIKENL